MSDAAGKAFDRVIVGTVVTPDAIIDHGYVAFRGETIAAIGEGALPPAVETIDHSGNLILPGLVDGHMHTSSSTGWPGIESATRCAAAGGVTTCCDMPYDVPAPVTDAAILADKIGWVQRSAHVDMALYGTIRKTGGIDAIPGLAAAGISAFKLSTYEYDAVRFPRIDHPTMLAAFGAIAKTGLPVAIHNEDQELVEFAFQPGTHGGARRADHALPHASAAGGDDGGPGDLRDGAGNRRACSYRALVAGTRLRDRRNVS